MATATRNHYSNKLSQLYASPRKGKQLAKQLNMEESTVGTKSTASSKTSSNDPFHSLDTNHRIPAIISFETVSNDSLESLGANYQAPLMASRTAYTFQDSLRSVAQALTFRTSLLKSQSLDSSSPATPSSSRDLLHLLDTSSQALIVIPQDSLKMLGSSCFTTNKSENTETGSWASSLLQDEDGLFSRTHDSLGTFSNKYTDFESDDDENPVFMFSWAETALPFPDYLKTTKSGRAKGISCRGDTEAPLPFHDDVKKAMKSRRAKKASPCGAAISLPTKMVLGPFDIPGITCQPRHLVEKKLLKKRGNHATAA